jgi:hypothetical protein
MDKRTKDFILAVGIMLAAYFLIIAGSDQKTACGPTSECQDKTP